MHTDKIVNVYDYWEWFWHADVTWGELRMAANGD